MEPLPTPSLFERIMATLPGWMLLLGGVAMVAMITLVPPWLECRRLNWQAQVMALQTQQLMGQQVAYGQFLTALREDDPVVVERMAYYHLRLKPVGTSTLDELQQMQTTQAAVYNQLAGHPFGGPGHAAGVPLNKVWNTLPTIEDLLAKPMYRPSQYCPAGVVPDTRMVRLVTGPARHLMLGFGVLCLFFGLLPASAGSIALARPTEDEYDYDDANECQIAVADEADELDHLFPDATTTAWALAGTGAVSVSAAGPANEADQEVLVAELDTQDDTLVEALTDEDDEADLVEAELDDATPVINDKEPLNDDADEDEEEEESDEQEEDNDEDDLEDEEDEESEEEGEEEGDEVYDEDDEDDEDEEFEDDDEEEDEEDED